jgi:hypothetical protein
MNDRAASRAVLKPPPASPGEAGDRDPQEQRSKPRFLHLLQMKTAWQAAGCSSFRESGINLAKARFARDTLNWLSRWNK